MAETKDGGPAFPAEGGYDSGLHPNPGMSLRDWFAGQALANEYCRHDSDPDKVAEWAYHLADAMLAAREGQGGGS